MTRTEAIEILTEVRAMDDSMYAYDYDPEYNEAQDMAIEALKMQEPVAPYRDSFLNWLCGYCKTEIDRYAGHKYCPNCGRKVKWE